jgi:hypothetical protein
MDRGEQGDLQTPRVNPQAQYPQAGDNVQQQQNPQAALAAVTHGEHGPPPPPQPRTDTDYTARPTTASTEKYPLDDGSTSESSQRREKADPYNRTGGVTIAPPPHTRSVRDGAIYRQGEPVMVPMRRANSGADWLAPNVVSCALVSPVNYR